MPLSSKSDIAYFSCKPFTDQDKHRSRASKVRYDNPVQVSEFSIDTEGKLYPEDSRALKKLRSKKIRCSLIQGLESYVEKEENFDHPALLDPLWNALMKKPELLSIKDKINVVSFRNNLNKILATPYNTQSDWTFNMQRHGAQTLVLDVQMTESDKRRRSSTSTSDWQQKCCYAGRYYEKLSTEPVRSKQDVPDNVCETEEYCGIFKCRLGNINLILAAELDCIDERDENKYVELKTFRMIESDKDKFVFERFKLLQFWIQSYLVGVPKIKCGFRDSNLVLRKEQVFKTNDLPKFASKYWDPNLCLHFANELLSWLHYETHNQDGRFVYKVTYHAMQRQVTIRRESRGSAIVIPVDTASYSSTNNATEHKNSA